MGEFLVPVLMMAVSSAFYIGAAGLPDNQGTPMVPATFPKILAVMLFCCSAVLLVSAIVRRKKSRKQEKEKILDKNMLIVAFLLAAFYVSLIYLGYLISSVWLCFTLSFFYKRNRFQVLDTIIFPILLPVGLYFAFRYMGVYLPQGKLIAMIF